MSLFRMTQEEYDRLNPPPDILFADATGWHYIGHIPAPRTRLGWFVHDIIHGLAMRYRILPVLAFSIKGLMDRQRREPCSIRLQSDESTGGLWVDYDETSDTILVYFDGKVPASVNWIDNHFATLLEDDTDRVVGFMVECPKLKPPKE